MIISSVGSLRLSSVCLQMHDCALTQNYFIVLAPPLLFQPEVGDLLHGASFLPNRCLR